MTTTSTTEEQMNELCLSPKKSRTYIETHRDKIKDDEEDDLNSLSSWHFDLGPLSPEDKEALLKHTAPTSVACSVDKDHAANKSRAGTAGTELSSEFDTDVDDLTSLSEEIEEANAAMLHIIKDQTRRASLNASINTISDMSMSINSHFSTSMSNNDSFWGDMDSLGNEDITSDKKKDDDDHHQHDTQEEQRKKQQEQQELLEQRKAAREARMKKVRQRIDREKKQAAKEQKKAAKNKQHLPKEARMQRAYEWWCRLGMISKKDMKQRCRVEETLGVSIDVHEDDIDLLPWNERGTYVNITKMPLMGAGLNSPKKKDRHHKHIGERLAI